MLWKLAKSRELGSQTKSNGQNKVIRCSVKTLKTPIFPKLIHLPGKMNKLKLFQKYFIIFYLFGLSPFIAFEERTKNPPLIFVHLPRLLSVILMVFISYQFYYQILLAHNVIMSYYLITFSIYMAFLENILLSHVFRITFRMVNITVEKFEQLWQIQCPLEALEKCFRRKFVFQILVILSGPFIKYFVRSHFGVSSIQDIALTLAFLYKCIHLLHATMYIDFIRHFEMCLCNRIKVELKKYSSNETKCQIGIRDKIRMLHQIKLIHFKLWQLTQHVNKQFGYFLTTVPVDTVSAVTFSFYWMFILLKLMSPCRQDVLRKNILILLSLENIK